MSLFTVKTGVRYNMIPPMANVGVDGVPGTDTDTEKAPMVPSNTPSAPKNVSRFYKKPWVLFILFLVHFIVGLVYMLVYYTSSRPKLKLPVTWTQLRLLGAYENVVYADSSTNPPTWYNVTGNAEAEKYPQFVSHTTVWFTIDAALYVGLFTGIIVLQYLLKAVAHTTFLEQLAARKCMFTWVANALFISFVSAHWLHVTGVTEYYAHLGAFLAASTYMLMGVGIDASMKSSTTEKRPGTRSAWFFFVVGTVIMFVVWAFIVYAVFNQTTQDYVKGFVILNAVLVMLLYLNILLFLFGVYYSTSDGTVDAYQRMTEMNVILIVLVNLLSTCHIWFFNPIPIDNPIFFPNS